MKLDRNLNADGRGKYGLILNRKLARADHILRDSTASLAARVDATNIMQAIETLERAGILDWGTTPNTEFFVMRLRDQFAAYALDRYALMAMPIDPEYGKEIYDMSFRAGSHHPNPKVPD